MLEYSVSINKINLVMFRIKTYSCLHNTSEAVNYALFAICFCHGWIILLFSLSQDWNLALILDKQLWIPDTQFLQETRKTTTRATFIRFLTMSLCMSTEVVWVLERPESHRVLFLTT